jgi:hypothetical protein
MCELGLSKWYEVDAVLAGFSIAKQHGALPYSLLVRGKASSPLDSDSLQFTISSVKECQLQLSRVAE